MIKEIKCFINNVGQAYVYDEGSRGYSIEQRITKTPGIYRCRIYHSADVAGALKIFNQIKGRLSAIQTRRQNSK